MIGQPRSFGIAGAPLTSRATPKGAEDLPILGIPNGWSVSTGQGFVKHPTVYETQSDFGNTCGESNDRGYHRK